MFAFDVVERLEAIVGPVEFKVAGNQLKMTPTLTDEQVDMALASIAQRIGMVDHTETTTTFELI